MYDSLNNEELQSGLCGLTLLRILDVLRKYSSKDNLLTQEEILRHLDEEYGLTLDRKALSRKIALLNRAGYSVETVHRKGTYLIPKISEAELHFLADTLLNNKYITRADTLRIVKALCELAPQSFKDRIKQTNLLSEMDKTDNSEFFKNVELIDQAKRQGKRISFYYYRYEADKKIHRGSAHEASPYQLIYHNQRYYLIAKNEKRNDVTNYRIDRIRDLKILPTDISDIRSVPGHKNGISYRAISALPSLYSDKPQHIVFRIKKGSVDQMIDFFGKNNVYFNKDLENEVEGSVDTSPMAIALWAKQNVVEFEILSPAPLRQKIKEELAAALQKYSR